MIKEIFGNTIAEDAKGQSFSIASKESNDFRLALLFIFFALAFKLTLSFFVYGTNDTAAWLRFATTLDEVGSFDIYGLIAVYNHPPLVSWILGGVSWLSVETGLAFSFVFRLLPILADTLSVFVIWKLLALYGIGNRVLIVFLCAFNPINFLISGFHSNTDPVFIFLVLLAIYLLIRNQTFWGGIVFGLSVGIKIVPLILLPGLIMLLANAKSRVVFLISFSGTVLSIFGLYLWIDPQALIKNIFQYMGDPSPWGVGYLLRQHILGSFEASLLSWYVTVFKPLLLAGSLGIGWILTHSDRKNFLQGTFAVFALFLILTPGFGVQYLSWLSLFAIILFPALGTLYTMIGGAFLLSVYHHWGASVPPYFANAPLFGSWGEVSTYLGIATWSIIVIMFARFLLAELRPSIPRQNE